MTERPADPLKACWLDQPTEETPMTVADIHARIGRFQAHKRCEAGFVLPAMAGVAGFFIWMTWTASSDLARLSGAIDLLWVLAVAFAFYWRWLRIKPAGAISLTGAEFHRRQLVVERNYRRSLWLWCSPVAAAYVLLVAGSPHPWGARALLADAIVAGALIAGSLVGRHGARKLQRQIDTLDHFGTE
jgi:hypothetical protein